MTGTLQALEFYCGVGGFAVAAAERVSVLAGLDINLRALDVYRLNFDHSVVACGLESLPREWLAERPAALWWLSPPCQPFTRRGLRRGEEDSRTASLLHLLECLKFVRLETGRPDYFLLENVVGFEDSGVFDRLLRVLGESGFATHWRHVCPTELGVPNRRPRCYVVAGPPGQIADIPVPRGAWRCLSDYLEPNVSEEFALPQSIVDQYRLALHVVEADDSAAATRTFTAAYGRSWVRSGSYLREDSRIRRFTPREVARLLGFPDSFRLPELAPERVWPLLGNSLSIPAVRWILRSLDPGSGRD